MSGDGIFFISAHRPFNLKNAFPSCVSAYTVPLNPSTLAELPTFLKHLSITVFPCVPIHTLKRLASIAHPVYFTIVHFLQYYSPYQILSYNWTSSVAHPMFACRVYVLVSQALLAMALAILDNYSIPRRAGVTVTHSGMGGGHGICTMPPSKCRYCTMPLKQTPHMLMLEFLVQPSCSWLQLHCFLFLPCLLLPQTHPA